VLDEQGRNTAGGDEGRRPRRRAGVPGEGPTNTGKQGTQEHRGEVRVLFPYPNWPRMWWKRVVDGEAVLGSAGGLEFGQGGAAAEKPGEELGGWLDGCKEEEGKSGEEMGFGLSFIGKHCSVEERERESRHRAGLRSMAGVDVPFGCVAAARHRRPDVAGRREASRGGAGGGRGSKATRGARGGQRRSAAGSGSGRRRWITRARQRQRRSGTRGRR
jgi:hypothetical protein